MMPTEKPILFSAPMVRAILEGRKTQTRRIVNPQPEPGLDHMEWRLEATGEWDAYYRGKRRAYTLRRCPYGQPGDRLWVRETWRASCHVDDESPSQMAPRSTDESIQIQYVADGAESMPCCSEWGKLRQSIFMPRWAARITLEVTGVRVERLQEISKADCIAEGISEDRVCGGERGVYIDLWDSINAKRAPWASNPFVWVIEFKRFNQ